MKTITILWQRLVTPAGETCERCHSTQATVEQAVPTLRQALRPLGIDVALDTREISLADFKTAPAESNRIWIDGRALEDWLGASVGSSTCCDACEGEECRTLEVGAETFETIPERLIFRAVLLAAAAALGPAPDESGVQSTTDRACCGTCS